MSSFFKAIELAPLDPILGLPILFKADPRKEKVNLGMGVYRTADGLPYLFETVSDVEKLIEEKHTPHEYLPIDGYPPFLELVNQLVFGKGVNQEKLVSVQSVGGTGALCIAAEFLKSHISTLIALPNLTWENHHLIFKSSGFKIQHYPYYSKEKKELLFNEMMQSLEQLPPKSVVLMHASCHNPTGADPTQKQWKELASLFKRKDLLALFDNAYQGFGESIEKDAFPIRLFLQEGLEMIVTTSFAKNMGLYNQRIGALQFVVGDLNAKKPLLSQLKVIIRSIYSSPPAHGAFIVTNILENPTFYKNWDEELGNLRSRIQQMREAFSSGLVTKTNSPRYDFIMHQKGFFSLLGLDEKQVMQLREEKGIYMLANSRINIAGLTPGNIQYTIDSIATLGI